MIKIERIANIIHQGIYGKDMVEDNPVRNLHIYAIARMIYNEILKERNDERDKV